MYVVRTHFNAGGAYLHFSAYDTLPISTGLDIILEQYPDQSFDFQPSIDYTPGDKVHITYRAPDGRIKYYTWQDPVTPDQIRAGVLPTWIGPFPVSIPSYEPASQPSVDADGEAVYCAFRGPDPNRPDKGEVYHCLHLLNAPPDQWFGHRPVSRTPDFESSDPQVHTSSTVIWQEEVEGDRHEIMVEYMGGLVVQMSTDPQYDNRWPHVQIVNPWPPNIVKYSTYALWTEDGPEHWARYRHFVYIPNFGEPRGYPTYLNASLGEEVRSPYCAARDGYRKYKHASVDYSENALSYQLPYLDRARDYLLELVAFNGEDVPITQCYSIGGVGRTRTIQPSQWDTLYVEIPRKAHRTTRAALAVSRHSGPMACLTSLKVYEVVFRQTGGDGAAGGTAMVEPARLTAWPNPFTASCRLQVPSALEGTRAEVRDVTGRLLRELTLKAGPAGPVATWDGRDRRGSLAAPGVYYCTVGSGVNAASLKLVRR